MSEFLPVYAALGLLAAALANIALWSPRRLAVKLAALGVTAVLLPAGYFALSEMLGRPKPVAFEWARQQLAEATVISAHMQEGQAIYLWLGIEDLDEPRAYVLPWTNELARQLHGAQREAEQAGAQVQMRLPFENSQDEREQKFFAQPQPPPPAKEQPAQNPLDFQRSQSGTDSTN